MSYNSIYFFVFTFVCLIIYSLSPKKFKKYILLLASVVFYWIFSEHLILASLSVTFIVYLISNKIARINENYKKESKNYSKEERKIIKRKTQNLKKKWIALECVALFSVLIIFKYLGFFTEIFNSVIALFADFKIPIIKLLLPIGISYYTLSLTSYAVDVYRDSIESEKNFAVLYLYAIYFPQIVEGPIGNYCNFVSQIKNPISLDYERFMGAFELILIGLIKKMIIADRAGIISSTFFDNYADYGAAVTVINIVFYTLFIYLDFSGCMDIVGGVSELFGISLPKNFRQPFLSKNVQEFWRRWHCTLGEWIKKYIFYSVSMSGFNQKIISKCDNIKNKHMRTVLPMFFSLLCVWLFTGLWHGASWKYAAYGMYYYILIVFGLLFEPVFNKVCEKFSINRCGKFFGFVQIFRTWILVMIGLTLFKSESVRDFIQIMGRLLCFVNPLKDISAFYSNVSLSILDFVVIAVFNCVIIWISVKKESGIDFREKLSQNTKVRWIVCTVAVVCILLLGVYGEMYTSQPFVYAQF